MWLSSHNAASHRVTRVRAGHHMNTRGDGSYRVSAPVYAKQMCSLATEQITPDTSVCRVDTGAIETCSYCHISQRVSPFSVNSNICSKYYGYHKTLCSHLCCRPPSLCWSVRLPHLWPGSDPRGPGGALHSGDIITITIIIIIIIIIIIRSWTSWPRCLSRCWGVPTPGSGPGWVDWETRRPGTDGRSVQAVMLSDVSNLIQWIRGWLYNWRSYYSYYRPYKYWQ